MITNKSKLKIKKTSTRPILVVKKRNIQVRTKAPTILSKILFPLANGAYEYRWGGLGDCWSFIMTMLKRSISEHKRQIITSRSSQIVSKFREILPLIDSQGQIEIVNLNEKTKIIDYEHNSWEQWKAPYFPTKVIWSPDKVISKTLACHFKGHASWRKKNCPEDHISKFISQAEQKGYIVINVTSACPKISDIVNLLSTADRKSVV
jgi:hypothetical protein